MNDLLVEQYQQMWHDAIRQFEAGHCDTDDFLNISNDKRRGLTLLARPGNEINKKIRSFQDAVKEIEPGQYYYPATDIHLTVLSIVSCYEGFKPAEPDIPNYSNIIQCCLNHPIQIRLEGITASPSGILIQGFPDSEELNLLRKRLRAKFNGSSLEHSIDSRYRLNTAHLTVVRFKQPITRPKELIMRLKHFRNFNFGTFTIDKLHLVYNDWYQSIQKVEELNTFALH